MKGSTKPKVLIAPWFCGALSACLLVDQKAEKSYYTLRSTQPEVLGPVFTMGAQRCKYLSTFTEVLLGVSMPICNVNRQFINHGVTKVL